ncbi:unnamed protein product [Strongylus vulgaris]|uniref:Uncharacterized protein n=1 Tax=Strongylus vulgaris TaxID=40348 RepID=A0A3P7KJS3_STRVU|nr:unnamed protein product [Strongylus vulgaris]
MESKNSGMDSSRSKTFSRGGRWADVFVTRMDQLNSQLVATNGSGPRDRRRSSIPALWMKVGCKQCWGLHGE